MTTKLPLHMKSIVFLQANSHVRDWLDPIPEQRPGICRLKTNGDWDNYWAAGVVGDFIQFRDFIQYTDIDSNFDLPSALLKLQRKLKRLLPVLDPIKRLPAVFNPGQRLIPGRQPSRNANITVRWDIGDPEHQGNIEARIISECPFFDVTEAFAPWLEQQLTELEKRIAVSESKSL